MSISETIFAEIMSFNTKHLLSQSNQTTKLLQHQRMSIKHQQRAVQHQQSYLLKHDTNRSLTPPCPCDPRPPKQIAPTHQQHGCRGSSTPPVQLCPRHWHQQQWGGWHHGSRCHYSSQARQGPPPSSHHSSRSMTTSSLWMIVLEQVARIQWLISSQGRQSSTATRRGYSAHRLMSSPRWSASPTTTPSRWPTAWSRLTFSRGRVAPTRCWTEETFKR